MSQQTNYEYFCSECNAVVNESAHVCQKCGADLSETIDEIEFIANSKPKSYYCDYCNTEKEGELLEWYEVYNNANRGVDIEGSYFYKCHSCGEIICHDCKKGTIKTSVFHGWAKGICPCCLSTFNPPVMPELERGKKVAPNKTSTRKIHKEIKKSFVVCNNCDKEVDSEFTFCNYCGKEIVKPKICEQCKIVFDWDANFCPKCGGGLELLKQ